MMQNDPALWVILWHRIMLWVNAFVLTYRLLV